MLSPGGSTRPRFSENRSISFWRPALRDRAKSKRSATSQMVVSTRRAPGAAARNGSTGCKSDEGGLQLTRFPPQVRKGLRISAISRSQCRSRSCRPRRRVGSSTRRILLHDQADDPLTIKESTTPLRNCGIGSGPSSRRVRVAPPYAGASTIITSALIKFLSCMSRRKSRLRSQGSTGWFHIARTLGQTDPSTILRVERDTMACCGPVI